MAARFSDLFQTDSVSPSFEPVLLSGRSRVHVEIEGLSPVEKSGSLPKSRKGIDLAMKSKYLSPDFAMLRGDAMFEQCRFDEAEQCFEDASQFLPDNADAYLKGAKCAYALGKVSTASQRLEAAARINPEMASAHLALGELYLLDGMIQEALKSSARAMELIPDDVRATTLQATILQYAGESQAAWELASEAVGRGMNSPILLALYAEMALEHDAAEAALRLIDQALSRRPHSIEHESTMRFAAGGLLDGLKRYDEAFEQAKRANFIRRPRYNADSHDREIEKSIEYFSPRRLRCLPRASYRDTKPVFVVGMPRSGTSLTEQILASHPGVYGAGELDFINRVFEGTLGMLSATVAEFPSCLDRLSVDRADGMAQIYLEPMKSLSPNALRIVDKMPLNFLHLGLISLLLPEAKIIHCRRDPLDNCLSCHMTNFVVAHDYKYELNNLGRFYRIHDRVMAHWKSVLDLPILEVDYEKVVADPEGQARRMVEFVGLPWDDRCVQFHKTKRAVVTASVAQVRKPIYSSSVQRWRNYEKHLGPLKQVLGV